MYTQTSTIAHLQEQNAQLRSQIPALQAENEQLCQSKLSVSALDEQLQRLVSSDTLSSGPDTLEQLESFSMEAIASCVNSLAPDVMYLFNTLEDTRRNVEKGVEAVVPTEIKALMSLCTVLNARSSRTKGKKVEFVPFSS